LHGEGSTAADPGAGGGAARALAGGVRSFTDDAGALAETAAQPATTGRRLGA
jgi:hypothetical protein